MKRAFFLLLIFCGTAALAHDPFYPMPPRKITYEFGAAGRDLPQASSIVAEITGKSLIECQITALRVTVDGTSISVPPSLFPN